MQKKIVLTTVLMLVVMVLLATGVQANYQSKPTGTRTNTGASSWITGIRKMEAANQVMGLNEQIDTTTGLATTDANDIDVHMAKNTEYGAAVLFGASDYGKQGTGSARYMNNGAITTYGTDVKASTTGNVYGVYEIGYYINGTSTYSGYEWTAGGGTSFLPNIAPRYINRYQYPERKADPKPGDATMETRGWHGSGSGAWLSGAGGGFYRGLGGAFYFDSYAASYDFHGRAVVVSGLGL